jgi:Uncharacterized protein conserved in archaea
VYVTLSFKFNTREEVERFLVFIQKHVKTTYIVNTRLTHVYVQLEGEGKELEDAVALVKRLAGLARGGRGIVQVPLLVMFRDAELTRPIPPDVVADALRFRGLFAEVQGDVLETELSYEEVLEAAETLSKMYEEAEKHPLTPQAKRVVVAYAFARGISIEAAVEELIKAGVLNRGAVLSLRHPPQKTRVLLLENLKNLR